jgi:catechol 2,3-dioxygenase-like lactoylglutathione lyase family enzyme
MVGVIGIDHVQLAMPSGGEVEAEAFYQGLLGIPRVPKPEPLASRGGAWFEDGRGLRVHLGVEEDFRPARKAHPAFRGTGLEELLARLGAAGHPHRDGDNLEGARQVYVDDPFGNRLELVEPTS